MAAVTICNDFGPPQNKVCHCFHCFPIYLPWSDGTRCHYLSFLNVALLLGFCFFFLPDLLFYYHVMLFYVISYSLCYKVYFCLQFSFHYYVHEIYFFHSFTFCLDVSLLIKWMSCWQQIDGSCFSSILPLHLLISSFSLFAF